MQAQSNGLRQERPLSSVPPSDHGQSIQEATPMPLSTHGDIVFEDRRPRRRETELDSFDTEVYGLQKELEQERTARIETQRRLNEAVEALGALHVTDHFRKDDNEIVSDVKALRYDIKAWSRNFSRPLKKSFIAKIMGHNNPFRSLTPRSGRYTGSESVEALPTIVQAFVWSVLVERVFDACVWTGATQCSLGGDMPCEIYRAFECLQSRFACKESMNLSLEVMQLIASSVPGHQARNGTLPSLAGSNIPGNPTTRSRRLCNQVNQINHYQYERSSETLDGGQECLH